MQMQNTVENFMGRIKKYCIDASHDLKHFVKIGEFKKNEIRIISPIYFTSIRISPIKDETVYEYKYLENVGGKEWWETVNYYTTKEECIKDMMVNKDCELQRITSTRRVRK